MPSAQQLRISIEQSLSQRIPAALTPAARGSAQYALTGVSALDNLHGGFPLGAVSELTGVCGSGRTALALAAVSTATRSGQVAAWVDVCSALDPESAAAGNVQLDRLLWVRCRRQAHNATDAIAHPPSAFEAPRTARVVHGGGSPHPRSEERGLSQAVNALLASPAKHRRDRVTGTPGAPNRPLYQASTYRLSARIEQAGTDRQPSRRGAYVLDQRERFTGSSVLLPQAPPLVSKRQLPAKPWECIDQALRVTDLLLRAGGFGIVVLDLADLAAEFVSRIPMATWFRFRAGAEHAQSALLVLTQHPCTGSSAALMLRMSGHGALKRTTVFPGLRFSIEVGRQRSMSEPAAVISMRKPPQSAAIAEWTACSPWIGCP